MTDVEKRKYVWLNTRPNLCLRIKYWKQQPVFIHILFIGDYYPMTNALSKFTNLVSWTAHANFQVTCINLFILFYFACLKQLYFLSRKPHQNRQNFLDETTFYIYQQFNFEGHHWVSIYLRFQQTINECQMKHYHEKITILLQALTN
jgi:hypothetical protein